MPTILQTNVVLESSPSCPQQTTLLVHWKSHFVLSKMNRTLLAVPVTMLPLSCSLPLSQTHPLESNDKQGLSDDSDGSGSISSHKNSSSVSQGSFPLIVGDMMSQFKALFNKPDLCSHDKSSQHNCCKTEGNKSNV